MAERSLLDTRKTSIWCWWTRAVLIFSIYRGKQNNNLSSDFTDNHIVPSLADEGLIKPILAKVLPFNSQSVEEGFELLKSRRAVGKIVFDMTIWWQLVVLILSTHILQILFYTRFTVSHHSMHTYKIPMNVIANYKCIFIFTLSIKYEVSYDLKWGTWNTTTMMVRWSGEPGRAASIEPVWGSQSVCWAREAGSISVVV